jgi:hypothetical protein
MAGSDLPGSQDRIYETLIIAIGNLNLPFQMPSLLEYLLVALYQPCTPHVTPADTTVNTLRPVAVTQCHLD